MVSLRVRAFGGLANLLIVVAAVTFGSARTLAYWQAWLFLAVFGISVAAITGWLLRHDTALLERRVRAGPIAERQTAQKIVQSIASIAFVAFFAISAIDHRAHPARIPAVLACIGDALVALGLYIVFRVFAASTFTAATIEVASEQHVVSTGPYAVVRHPMYAGALIMLAGVPLALGSAWALLVLVPMTVTIAWRAVAEERFLRANLQGYGEYCERVKHRLVPHLW